MWVHLCECVPLSLMCVCMCLSLLCMRVYVCAHLCVHASTYLFACLYMKPSENIQRLHISREEEEKENLAGPLKCPVLIISRTWCGNKFYLSFMHIFRNKMLIHTPNMSTQQIPFVVTLSKIVSFFILHLDSMMQSNTPLLIIKRKPRMLQRFVQGHSADKRVIIWY